MKRNKSRRKRQKIGRRQTRGGRDTATKKENRIIWPDIRSVEYLTSCPDAWISGECIVVATPPLIRKLAFFHVPSFDLLPLSLLRRHSISPFSLPSSNGRTFSPFFLFSPSSPIPSLFGSPKFEARVAERAHVSSSCVHRQILARWRGGGSLAAGGRMGNFTAAKCFTARINAGGSMTTTGKPGRN